eukprot:jgi/Mesen1/3999/ME000211S03178
MPGVDKSREESSKKKEPVMRIMEPSSRRYSIFNSYAEARNVTWSLRGPLSTPSNSGPRMEGTPLSRLKFLNGRL